MRGCSGGTDRQLARYKAGRLRDEQFLATTAVHQLHKIKGKYALCTMCIGVGQGIALVLERV
jgi:hypothetical protein